MADVDRTCAPVPDGTWCVTHNARWTHGTARCVRSGWNPVEWVTPTSPRPPYCILCTFDGHTYMDCPDRLK